MSLEEPPLKSSSPDTSSIEPIIVGPFRFIKPYPFTFVCNSKKRWYKRKLIEVFTQEFKHWSRETILDRIRNGNIIVNGHQITEEYIIQEHDRIEHTVFRTESPVYNIPIEKLDETENYIAFHKPGSVPVHATGGFYYNAMVKRIDKRFYPVHRLDRVTGGIIVMAKNQDAARHFGEMLEEGKIHKTYVARVMGVFPEGDIKCDAPIRESPTDRKIRECGEGGKESLTTFKRLQTNGIDSIVECHPITGRTHQIRVHLAHLGFPIGNDEMYGGTRPALSEEEMRALQDAERQKLWPPDTALDKDEPLTFMIWLHSIKYESDDFSFSAPMPEWAHLEEQK